MEHLFCTPSQNELDSIADRLDKSREYSCDWHTAPLLSKNITWPVYEWLGFGHDHGSRSPALEHFKQYAMRYAMNGEPNIENVVARLLPVCALTGFHSKEDLTSSRLAFLQSWLTFGFLETILEKCIRLNFLTRVDGAGRNVIDTRNLTFALYVEKRKAGRLSESQLQRRVAQLEALFAEHLHVIAAIRQVITELSQLSQNQNTRYDSVDILVNIAFVSSLISEIVAHVWCGTVGGRIPSISLGGPPPWIEFIQPLRDKLVSKGMCPNFLKTTDLRRYTILSWLGWWAQECGIPCLDDHSKCSENACILDKTPPYEPQHSPACVSKACKLVQMPFNLIKMALESGAHPLLKLKTPQKESYGHEVLHYQTRIEVDVACTYDLSSTEYVAFSHVWRHGLGSTTEQGLLDCQLRVLWEALALHDEITYEPDGATSTLFWIDSLCIPSSPEHRRLAIQGINSIFTRSNRTIVLDHALRLMSTAEHKTESILAAIKTSAWRTR